MSRELYISEREEKDILSAISIAEKKTTGEIRVYFETKCRGKDPLARAKKIFLKLGMQKTKDRNAVLIYIAIRDRLFAICGDIGIDEVVPLDFWDSIKDLMVGRFKQKEIAEGIYDAVLKVGEKLNTYFPYRNDDTNELTDDISFSS